MTATIHILPLSKQCAMCRRRATRNIDLVNEFGQPQGKKYLCDDYPWCGDESKSLQDAQ